jgi:hypothetical protein
MVSNTTLTREEVAAVLTERLSFLSSNNSPREIRGDLVVLHEWGLDSEHGVELACDLSARLKLDIPSNDNPLIDESAPTNRKRARTFDEVVTHLLSLASQ